MMITLSMLAFVGVNGRVPRERTLQVLNGEILQSHSTRQSRPGGGLGAVASCRAPAGHCFTRFRP